VSALYARGDPYETSDAVFGVKDSLVVDYTKVNKELAKKYGVREGSLLVKYDLVLVSDGEVSDLRDKNSRQAIVSLGRRVKFLDGILGPDVD
jgi:hypothetical protein